MQQELQEAVCALFQVSSDYVPSKVRCLLSLWAMFSASFHSVSWTFLVFSEPLDESYMASPDAIQPRVLLPSTEYPYRSHHAVVSPHSWISQWFGSNLLLSKLYLRKNVSFLLLGTLRVPLHSSPILHQNDLLEHISLVSPHTAPWSQCGMALGGEGDWFPFGWNWMEGYTPGASLMY